MQTIKSITISFTAIVLLAIAPGARAQSPDDLQLMQTFLSIMGDYFEIIESVYDISSDPEKAAIMQMQKIQEVYEERGDKLQSKAVLENVLATSDSAAIRNAAYMMLGDTLKEAGRGEEALEFLRKGLEENIKAAE